MITQLTKNNNIKIKQYNNRLGNILKGFGYGIAVILIIGGIALFAVDFETAIFGIVLIIIGIIIIWAISRSGKGSRMQETQSKGYDTTKTCPICYGIKTTDAPLGGVGGIGGLGGIRVRPTCWKCHGSGKVKN